MPQNILKNGQEKWLNIYKRGKKRKMECYLEGTLRKAELPIREAKDFKENGYSVELWVVAVKPENLI